MYDLRAAESVTATALLAVTLAGLFGAVFVGSVVAADLSEDPGHDVGASTAGVSTLVPTVRTDTPDILNTTTPTSTPTGTITGTVTATSAPTDSSTSTVTPEDTLSGVTNETENVTETITNTTGTVTNTTVTVSNTTDGTVDEVTNTTDGTVDEVTNTTENATEAATNGTGDLVDETTNLTATVTVGGNVSVGIGSTPTSDTTTRSTATRANTSTSTPGPTGTSVSTAGTNGSSTTGGTGDGASSAGGSSGSTREPTRSVTAAAPPGGHDGPNDSAPFGSPGGAVLGGALVVAGVAAAAASKHVAAVTPAAQGQELVWVGRAVRLRVDTAAQLVRERAARLPRLLLPVGYSRYDDSDPLEHDARQALFERVERSPGVNLSTLADDADVSLSSVRHHLRILEEENLVVSERIRGQRRYFLTNESDPALVAALDDTATEPILRTLARSGPASVSDLAETLGRDPSTISHHVSRLEDDGLVDRERDGQSVQNSLAPVAERVLGRSAPGQKRSVVSE